MWAYSQSTGALRNKHGDYIATGYAGHGEGKNNPDLQWKKNTGPLPRGFYEIGAPFDSDSHGPYCLRLTPFPENEMFDRAGFLIHGDSKSLPGTASEGCIILPPAIRKLMWASDDRLLEVTL